MPRSPASKPPSVLLGSPPKPKLLAVQQRAASIITPQSSTLLNARVVSIAPDGTETDLRRKSNTRVGTKPSSTVLLRLLVDPLTEFPSYLFNHSLLCLNQYYARF